MITEIIKKIVTCNKGDLRMEEKFSDVIGEVQFGYIMNGCEGCPFYGIEEYEIKQRCDSTLINCLWMLMYFHFSGIEECDNNCGEV